MGILCSLIWRYEDELTCYKKAYEKLRDPPDSLLLLLAACRDVPGTPRISLKEAESFLERALAKKFTYEAAVMKRDFAEYKNDPDEIIYWEKICEDLKKSKYIQML